MEKGYLSFIFHAHLPFVRHPEYEEFLEENWFFEALTDTYIPFLEMMENLTSEGVNFSFTMNLSPSLLNMMADDLLKERYIKYLDRKIELSYKETERTKFVPEFNKLANLYLKRFISRKEKYLNSYHTDLIKQFRFYKEKGYLEIITCGATHGFLPLLNINPEAVRAQIRVGINTYRKFFSSSPRGIWLPECGYFEGLDKFLREEGIRYFILETHGITFAKPRPKFGVYSSYYTEEGVACFGRDPESSQSVWSAKDGYPGDYDYREYYRDIGFDADYDYIKPYISPMGERIFTGIKYYRITSNSQHKEPYQPQKAKEKAAEHAGNFLFNRTKQIEYLSSLFDRKPIVICPYDAELFGHWWFEGLLWLEFLVKKIHYDQNTIKLITPSKYLSLYPKNQVIQPAPSSWGWKGYYEMWLNGNNDWIYPHLHRAAEAMSQAIKKHSYSEEKRRLLDQMLRELLLAQSSDWAFMMQTGSFSEYARKRTITHLERFYTLKNYLDRDFINYELLEDIENRDNIFSEVSYEVYQ